MTSPRRRQGRPSTSINHEAALVGALTAFVKSPAASTSPGTRPAPNTAYPAAKRSASYHAANLKPPGTGNTPQSSDLSSTVSPGKPLRHDSGLAPSVKAIDAVPKQTIVDKAQTRSGNPRPKPVPEVARKSESLRLKVEQRAPRKPTAAAPRSSIDAVVANDGSQEDRIPSTSSLVQLFEQQGTTTAAIGLHTPLKSPKPVRRSLVLSQDDRTVSSQIDEHLSEDATPSTPESFTSAPDILSPQMPNRISSTDKPALPPPRRDSRFLTTNVEPTKSPVSPVLTISHSSPIQIKDTRSTYPYHNDSAATSSASITATYNSLHPRRLSALRTGDSLANAIVASSLASSRAPSPSKFPPSATLQSKHSHHSFFSRTPSPHKHKPPSTSKGMRQTLRTKQSSSSNDDDEDPYAKHKRKRHIRKHANKYNEGDRKRWREVVTERERTRYEGVWAANRGILVDTSNPQTDAGGSSWKTDNGFETSDATTNTSDDVHAFVVRDIWSRSRLPSHVLEEIWDLVELNQRDKLNREEFVVGMWLVDQRLKGRKLPMKVSDSVWDSVRFLKGIRIRAMKTKEGRRK